MKAAVGREGPDFLQKRKEKKKNKEIKPSPKLKILVVPDWDDHTHAKPVMRTKHKLNVQMFKLNA